MWILSEDISVTGMKADISNTSIRYILSMWGRSHSLLQWTQHLDHPEASPSTTRCTNCREQPSKLNSVHCSPCSLCAYSHCQRCTGLYQLPHPLSNGVNPVRVCFSCRDQCYRMAFLAFTQPLEQWEEWAVSQSIPVKRHIRRRQLLDGAITVLPPLVLEDRHDTNCFLCDVELNKKAKTCCLCGDWFCNDCLSKRKSLPAMYKQIAGHAKVCDVCRFYLFRGLTTVIEDYGCDIAGEFYRDDEEIWLTEHDRVLSKVQDLQTVQGDDSSDDGNEQEGVYEDDDQLTPLPLNPGLMEIHLIEYQTQESVGCVMVPTDCDLYKLYLRAERQGIIYRVREIGEQQITPEDQDIRREVIFIYKDIPIPRQCWSFILVKKMRDPIECIYST